jgi:hypothetical protein
VRHTYWSLLIFDCEVLTPQIPRLPFTARGFSLPRLIVKVYDVWRYADEKRDALERWASRLLAFVEPPTDNVVLPGNSPGRNLFRFCQLARLGRS